MAREMSSQRRVLLVREPWATMLVRGEKKAELRRKGTRARGWVGVAVPHKKQRIGDICIKNSEKVAIDQIDPDVVKLSRDEIRSYASGKTHLHLWHVENSKCYDSPVPCEVKRGAVVWALQQSTTTNASEDSLDAAGEKLLDDLEKEYDDAEDIMRVGPRAIL